VDPNKDRRAEDIRIDEIRREIETTRSRVAETIDALRYKADLPARLGDVLTALAEGAAAQVAQRLATSSQLLGDEDAGEDRTSPVSDQNAEVLGLD
jgi:Protein of unknown function (DUF3618)